jgi:hypothetical protein
MKKMVTKPVKKAANCSNLEVMCQTTRNDPGLGRRRMTITDQARVIRDYMAFRAGREPTAGGQNVSAGSAKDMNAAGWMGALLHSPAIYRNTNSDLHRPFGGDLQ